MDTKAFEEKILEILNEVKELNPYPESVFIPIPDDKIKEIVQFLTANGYSTDALYGNWGREVWNNCIGKLSELIESEISALQEAKEPTNDFCTCEGKPDVYIEQLEPPLARCSK